MTWSITVMSGCPVTTGTISASHAAASASVPVRNRESPSRAAIHPCSSADAPSLPRSSRSGMCAITWVSAPARSGTILARSSSSQASCSAS